MKIFEIKNGNNMIPLYVIADSIEEVAKKYKDAYSISVFSERVDVIIK
jgi:hypothetical protein